MTMTVNTWATNARNAETEFFGIVARAFEQFNSGNYSDLAKLLCICHGKKSKKIQVIEGERLKFASHLKRILDASVEGEIKYKFDPDTTFGVVITKGGDNAGFSAARIEALKVLGKATVQSAAYKEAFPPKKSAPKSKTAKEKAETMAKGKTRAEIAAMVKELAAIEIALKELAKSAPKTKAA